MDDEKHYPGEQETVTPAEEPKAPEGEQPEVKPEAEQPKEGEEKAPEAEAPKDEPEPEPEPKLSKKRSIYDDLKDTRKELKEAKQELERLKDGKEPESKPEPKEEPQKPADELEAYAEENGLDAKQLGRLVEIMAKRLPTSQLSEDDKQALSQLKDWRAQQSRAAEDAEIRTAAPSVQKELSITDAGELQKVMDEVVRLAHTPEYHDKEVDYIVWKNRAALSKLVSPKKPSFEQGGQPGAAEPEQEPDFSKGSVTPETAGKAMYSGTRGSSMEVRPSK